MANASRLTGGQYSLLRVLLGAATGGWISSLTNLAGLHVAVGIAGFVAGFAIAAGVFDRVLSILAAVSVIAIYGQATADPGYGPVLVCLLLLIHAMAPQAPFGSWAARGRSDPGGGWTMPDRNRRLIWIVLSVAYAYLGLALLDESLANWPLATALIAFGPLALVPRLRAMLWTVFLIGHLAATDLSALGTNSTWLLFHLFLFTPAWVRPAQRKAKTVVFFDGTCGLCHRTVRLLIAEDAYDHLQFAPLQGSTFEATRGDRAVSSFPDSLIVFSPTGDVLSRSRAVLDALTRLGGFWRVLAMGLRVIPRGLRDALYNVIARVRKSIFAKPKQLCPLMPHELTDRFLP